MEAITSDQVRGLIASFLVDTPWDEITTGIQSFIKLAPTERGKRFASFVGNGCRLGIGGKLYIDRSKPFNPDKFFQCEGWSIWRGPATADGLKGEKEEDENSLALTGVDPDSIVLDAALNPGKKITGEERLHQLAAKNAVKMDIRIFQVLWNNKHLIPERLKDEIADQPPFVFVDGTTFRSPKGYRYTLCFYWDTRNHAWYWYPHRLENYRHANNPSALLVLD